MRKHDEAGNEDDAESTPRFESHATSLAFHPGCRPGYSGATFARRYEHTLVYAASSSSPNRTVIEDKV